MVNQRLKLKNMKVGIINTTQRRYGGTIYQNELLKALSEKFRVEVINCGVKHRSKIRYLEGPLVLWQADKASRKKDLDITIKDFNSSLFLNPKPCKNIALVHHIDSSSSPIILRIVSPFLEKIILHNLKKFDAIVVVSKYWKDYFGKRGYKNIHLIYNGFSLEEFNLSQKEIIKFKNKYGLVGKPIIYLGTCQKGKGVVEAYHNLQGVTTFLVTSGEPRVKIPAINLDLEYKEYLCLLKASSIVLTMSKFKEGWCRNAHEAMLCKTPVIGSGAGGMRELLEGGKQFICEDFKYLKKKVEYLLHRSEVRERMGEDGYNFAKKFTLERFKKDWVELLKSFAMDKME